MNAHSRNQEDWDRLAVMAAATDLSEFENDPRLFLFTSLTAGSSHIITATSRLETILKANKIPFQAIDTATDEKARRLWQRRAQKKKLPGLVKDGFVIGDLDEVEEWNEFGELKENIGDVPANEEHPAGGRQGVSIRPLEAPSNTVLPGTESVSPPTSAASPPLAAHDLGRVALPGASEILERNKAKSPSTNPLEAPIALESMNSAPADKETSINAAKEAFKHHSSLDHLSAPASQIQSGTTTPQSELATQAPESVDAASQQHRGSEVKEAPPEEIKRLESENALHEEADEDEEATKGLQGLKVGEGEQTQDQSAKQPDDAGKSVED